MGSSGLTAPNLQLAIDKCKQIAAKMTKSVNRWFPNLLMPSNRLEFICFARITAAGRWQVYLWPVLFRLGNESWKTQNFSGECKKLALLMEFSFQP